MDLAAENPFPPSPANTPASVRASNNVELTSTKRCQTSCPAQQQPTQSTMNGARETRPDGDVDVLLPQNDRLQLPTPALSPVIPANGHRQHREGERERDTEDSSVTSDDSHSRSQSVQDEAVPLDGLRDSRLGPRIHRQGRRRKSSVGSVGSPTSDNNDRERVLKLSPAQIQELTSSPTSLPIRVASPVPEEDAPLLSRSPRMGGSEKSLEDRAGLRIFEEELGHNEDVGGSSESRGASVSKASSTLGTLEEETGHNGDMSVSSDSHRPSVSKTPATKQGAEAVAVKSPNGEARIGRPSLSARAISTPTVLRRKHSSQRNSEQRSGRTIPSPLILDEKGNGPLGSGNLKTSAVPDSVPSPMPPSMPLPPLSIPTYLQLELSSDRPSPLYIYRPSNSDFPYESSAIKFERILNFLYLPPQLEQILGFGALACFDAWLYVFTILPLRFLKAVWVLIKWWAALFVKEIRDLASFVYWGTGRVWRRRKLQKPEPAAAGNPADEGRRSRRPSVSNPLSPNSGTPRENGNISYNTFPEPRKYTRSSAYRHRRTKSTPSALMPSHKADLLKGLLVIASCAILMRFDASKMYHGIRGQAAIKLYVIYNVLEVCDRLFSALGQDVLECLFSKETLDRNADGRSKVIRPFYMFILALAYNVIHATALFYQVITLNVAVNSYSNALLTLLMSNQFVEIKGTVFKKFEKENLFQLTCADVVERFQLWLMLMIIAMRNIVEVGGLSISLGDSGSSSSVGSNSTGAPTRSTSIIPLSFTIFPKWTGQVFGPFLLVLGSEMLVDWVKHSYITKFNNVKPAVYGRFLDVLAKDYYSNAFADQNLTKRLGLPVLPLSCLFIRALVQTYHMFLATHMPPPLPSAATSLSTDSSSPTSPATTAALAHIDHIFRRALGRSSFGAGGAADASTSFNWWSVDDLIAFATMLVVFLVCYLVLLALKLVLGMCLLSFARGRYKDMKERERMGVDTKGKRVGGWGVVEVEEEKRRWIYADDPEGLKALRERDAKGREREAREREKGGGDGLGGVSRYAMVAKRIW
ncbi:DUF747-domain-containing protein [Lophium mytilinum]|uniref:DUF747-domain-containing protein n=1 Tax=Lophium mytilinum TaxID=390894 RepID=A0A6A6QSV9_9PEZI|nr:DUF747-domain-containing protein [Lophium mytilinum]